MVAVVAGSSVVVSAAEDRPDPVYAALEAAEQVQAAVAEPGVLEVAWVQGAVAVSAVAEEASDGYPDRR